MNLILSKINIHRFGLYSQPVLMGLGYSLLNLLGRIKEKIGRERQQERIWQTFMRYTECTT